MAFAQFQEGTVVDIRNARPKSALAKKKKFVTFLVLLDFCLIREDPSYERK